MTRKISLLLAGDALITRPWSHVTNADFLGLIKEIRDADVAIANLETVIHDFKGHAQADSGGIYMASPPVIAAELKWAGFNMLAHANNHSFDYGSSGVLETIEYVESNGLIVAGSGRDLQSARAPRYFQCECATVALVAMAADFVPYGKASFSRPDLHGRPGVNPLTLTRKESTNLRPLKAARQAWSYFRRALRAPSLGQYLDPDFAVLRDRQVALADANANLDSISEAASNAGIVVVSIHAHRQGRWLRNFAQQAIERGASVIFIHGPHHTRGIELYQGRPIFYSMGDFVFETEYVARFPSEAYERLGLAPVAQIDDLKAVDDGLNSKLLRDRGVFEGFITLMLVAESVPTKIQLVPIDLGFDSGDDSRGRPHLASKEMGERIINTVAARSRKFGTRIRYDPGTNRGEVIFATQRSVERRE
jgi:poly-gamma-glutamate capsule biosynthesis protein CapA/YwtB (metallophosphatase superfamily)